MVCSDRGTDGDKIAGSDFERPKAGPAGVSHRDVASIPGNKTRLEPNALPEKHAPGGRATATSPWGVLSGIVLGAWESHAQGEGPDGSTQRA